MVYKLLAREAAEGLVKGYHNNAIDTHSLQESALLLEGGEQLQPLVVAECDAWMGFEGEHNALSVALLGSADNLVEQYAMTAMDSVVGAHRCHGIA